MKIVLAALNAKYVHSNLAVYDLAGYVLKQQNKEKRENADKERTESIAKAEVVVKEYTINHNLDLILQSLYQEKADVAAFSCYIWNIHEILTIARELKKVAPQIHIWLGGPEVGYDSRERLEENPFVEGIIFGEGEVTFYELVRVWSGQKWDDRQEQNNTEPVNAVYQKNNTDEWFGKSDIYRDVLGIVYRDAFGGIHENGKRPLMALDELPFVYQDLSAFENKILYYETSRGCPFSCSYCLSSIDKRVRFRSLSLVRTELQFFLDHKVPQVKFIDRTFNCNREHSVAIWKYITEHDNGVTNFHFEVAADLIGEEELAVFRDMRPGLIQLEIGLQSTNPATIREIRRVMDVERLKRTMLTIRSFGNIHQHLDLIAGLPFEDFVTFKKSFNEAYAMRPNQLQLGFLKVLKGSYMGTQIENYGICYQDVQPYEVLCTKWIRYDEILALKKVEEMVEVYYNSAQFEHVLSYLIPFFGSAYAFYEALGSYYEEQQLFGIGFKREARYAALREFCIKWFKKSDENDLENECIQQETGYRSTEKGLGFQLNVFDSLLTFDYYLRENAKSRPCWAKEEPIEKSVYQEFFKRGGNGEVSLVREGYDSKAAARMMHVEPVVRESVGWISAGEPMGHIPSEQMSIEKTTGKEENLHARLLYCLFDYAKRNPLSKDAHIVILSHL